MPVAAAVALGAIVAPPDAVAATAIFRRLGVPRRIVTILEGESLLNDASALIVYRLAVVAGAAAASSVAFSLGSAASDFAGAVVAFVVVGAGGLAVGAIVGAIVTRTLHRTGDPVIEIIVTLLAPATAYIAAEQFGVSGVLATVVAGLITGRRGARVLSPDARLMGFGVWQTIIWLINASVFMLIGLQLPSILEAVLADHAPEELLRLGLAVSATAIIARIVWVYPATYLPRFFSKSLRARDPYPPARAVFIISWAGMRGVVSLAAAFALPPDFPSRDLILFLTFCVIVATLVGQGLTLPWLIRHLGVLAPAGQDGEEVHARLAAVEAALQRLEELKDRLPGPSATDRAAPRRIRARSEPCAAEHGAAPSTKPSRSSSTTGRSATRSSSPSERRSSACAMPGSSTTRPCDRSSATWTLESRCVPAPDPPRTKVPRRPSRLG